MKGRNYMIAQAVALALLKASPMFGRTANVQRRIPTARSRMISAGKTWFGPGQKELSRRTAQFPEYEALKARNMASGKWSDGPAFKKDAVRPVFLQEAS